MKNTIKLTRKANTVCAPYLPYAAYNALVQLGKDHNAEIGENADHTLRLTFNEVETAKNVVAKWTAEYNANRKVEVAPVHKSVPAKKSSTSKPTATKGKTKATTSSTKKTAAPRKAKGEAFDFTQFKGTNSEKNKALHALLVSKGIKDSRTPEYMSIWNARPWAK
jgi:hypothetical protein